MSPALTSSLKGLHWQRAMQQLPLCFALTSLENPACHPLLRIPGSGLDIVFTDLMHCKHLGTDQLLLGSAHLASQALAPRVHPQPNSAIFQLHSQAPLPFPPQLARHMSPKLAWCYQGEDLMQKVKVLAQGSF